MEKLCQPFEKELPSFREAYVAILSLPENEQGEKLMLIAAESLYRMQLEHLGYRKIFDVYENPNGDRIVQHDESVSSQELDKHLINLAEAITEKTYAIVRGKRKRRK